MTRLMSHHQQNRSVRGEQSDILDLPFRSTTPIVRRVFTFNSSTTRFPSLSLSYLVCLSLFFFFFFFPSKKILLFPHNYVSLDPTTPIQDGNFILLLSSPSLRRKVKAFPFPFITTRFVLLFEGNYELKWIIPFLIRFWHPGLSCFWIRC